MNYARAWYYENHERELEKRRVYSRKYALERPLNAIYKGAKSRAKQTGVEFTITKEEIIVPDVCPILGTPFVRKTPFAMSMDRIDPNKGYIPGNVQIISRKANVMKNDATVEELKKFAQWIGENY